MSRTLKELKIALTDQLVDLRALSSNHAFLAGPSEDFESLVLKDFDSTSITPDYLFKVAQENGEANTLALNLALLDRCVKKMEAAHAVIAAQGKLLGSGYDIADRNAMEVCKLADEWHLTKLSGNWIDHLQALDDSYQKPAPEVLRKISGSFEKALARDIPSDPKSQKILSVAQGVCDIWAARVDYLDVCVAENDELITGIEQKLLEAACIKAGVKLGMIEDSAWTHAQIADRLEYCDKMLSYAIPAQAAMKDFATKMTALGYDDRTPEHYRPVELKAIPLFTP